MILIIRPSIRIRVEISYKPIHKRAVDIREYPIRPAQQLDLSNNQKFFSDRDHSCEFGQGKANACLSGCFMNVSPNICVPWS